MITLTQPPDYSATHAPHVTDWHQFSTTGESVILSTLACDRRTYIAHIVYLSKWHKYFVLWMTTIKKELVPVTYQPPRTIRCKLQLPSKLRLPQLKPPIFLLNDYFAPHPLTAVFGKSYPHLSESLNVFFHSELATNTIKSGYILQAQNNHILRSRHPAKLGNNYSSSRLQNTGR